MLRRIAQCLALFIVAAGPALASDPYPYPAPRMDILVDGRVLTRYPAGGLSYVEALKGREYEIRLSNPYPVRVAVALAVDGLNTIDARHTSAAAARKWVIDPYGSITISGWQTSMTEARRFHFTTEEKSYGRWLGQTDDLGIITAVFFRERVAQPVVVPPVDARGPEGQASRAGRGAEAAPAPPARSKAEAAGAAGSADYAATGIGRPTDHLVRTVHMNLEETPVASVNIRYEYRPQLVRLGILPPTPVDPDPLARRQGAHGFEPGFCPVPKRDR